MRRWPKKYLSERAHLPVMKSEVVDLLKSCPSGVFVDATLGEGGHMLAVFKAYGDHFKYFGIDLNSKALDLAGKTFTSHGLDAELVKLNFSEIARFLQRREINSISAILFDLGTGSYQIDDPEQGFSYLKDGPLSLSFNDDNKTAAMDLIESLNKEELTEVFRSYGQEPKAKRIARAIKGYPQKITTTGQLSEVIRSVVGSRYFVKTAARVFQALRIKVNDELGNIQKGLENVLPLLMVGGRAIVISYHSLEDGLVKRIFKKYSGKCICPSNTLECRCGKRKLVHPVFAKPLRSGPDEIANNPRARSAKLRVVEKIVDAP
jgi:16S rRNA (cytosine1402-N4)-methyltransferase